ncbi:MAG TPA: hypothetical protein VGN26_06035 [Armatimonadota bacterium]|jgi:hypothetical protein
MDESSLKPRMPIRRFDVFAEYNRLEALRDGLPEDEAKGHGLWIAKVVASKKFSRKSHEMKSPSEEKKAAPAAGKWHTLDGEEQTDALFEKEIVARMGPDFYRDVFAPTLGAAVKQGLSYKAIRDTIRAEWKPEE